MDRSIASATRRSVLAGMAAAPLLAGHAGAQVSAVHTRRIPGTDIALPVIGLGTFVTFDLIPGAPRTHLYDVARRYWDAGARIVDTSPLYGMGEVNAGDFMAASGLADRLFVSNKLWTTGDYLAEAGASERALAQSEQRLWRAPIDVMHVHNLTNVEQNLPLLKAWKAEGKIRFHGITHHDFAYYDIIAAIMEKQRPDFIQIRYSIATRQAEKRILPLAQDRGIAVAAAMPFEKARLFQLVGNRPVPSFAREIGIQTWADYFLKWIVSHPAILAAYPATANPEHASQNLGALRGTLPDAAMRAMMLRFMEGIPGFDRLEEMPWYPGKRYPGVIARATAEREARLKAQR